MKSKFLAVALCIAMLTVGLTACKSTADENNSSPSSKITESTNTASDSSSAVSEIKNEKIPYSVHAITDEAKADSVEALLQEKLGTVDEETGYTLSYNVDGTVDYNGKTFYLVWMRWLVTDSESGSSHSSRVGEFIVSDDLSTVYAADVDGTNINFETKNLI